MLIRPPFRNIPPARPNNHAKLNYVPSACRARTNIRRLTLVVRAHAARDLDAPAGRDVRRRGLEEEEGLLGHGVAQLGRVRRVVAPDGHDLRGAHALSIYVVRRAGEGTFLPWRTKEAMPCVFANRCEAVVLKLSVGVGAAVERPVRAAAKNRLGAATAREACSPKSALGSAALPPLSSAAASPLATAQNE